VGFALGLERLVALVQDAARPCLPWWPHAYLVLVGEAAQQQGLLLAEQWRNTCSAAATAGHCGAGNFKTHSSVLTKAVRTWH